MFSTETIERLLKVIPHNETYSYPIEGLVIRHADQPFCYEGIIQEPSICIVLSGEREIQLGEQGGKFKAMVNNGSHTKKIAQATHYLQQHFSETITVETLANLSGMSLSGFHSHFKKITSLSPLQYQKSLRLMEARRLIAQEGRGITETAYQVGYESPSQFSREYKRYFGHAPKGDIK